MSPPLIAQGGVEKGIKIIKLESFNLGKKLA